MSLIYTNCNAGGVALYAKRHLDMKIRNDLKLNVEKCEDLWANVTINDRTDVIGVIYRHPRQNYSSFQDAFCDKLNFLNSRKSTYYVCGDFNINTIRSSTKNAIKFFTDSVHACSSVNLIDHPTRITDRSATLLDHIYTNDMKRDLLPGIILQDISDHLPIFMQIVNTQSSKSDTIRKIRDMRHLNKEVFNFDLETKLENPASSIFDISDENDFFNKFNRIFCETVNLHAPLRNATRREKKAKQKPWMTPELIKATVTKNKLYVKFVTTQNNEIKKKYNEIRNNVNRHISKAKKEYYSKKLIKAQNCSKLRWKVINEIIGNKRKNKFRVNKIKNKNGQMVKTPKKVANIFNDYFSNVGPELAAKIPDTVYNLSSQPMHHSLRLYDTNPDEVEQVIHKQNSSKATRSMDAPTKFIKMAKYVISGVLAKLFNYCMRHGKYPQAMKISQVIPIHKRGPKDIVSNFRPISLQNQINKVFEKILYKRVYNYFEKYNILTMHQYGFRKKRSTALAIYDILEKKSCKCR